MESKKCNHCQELKDLTEFSFEKRNTDGRKGICRICQNRVNRSCRKPEQFKQWVKDHPQRWREIQIKHRYGLTKEETDAILNEQDWKCAVCKEPFTEAFHIDHDHSCCSNEVGKTCGKCIRGFLCKNCNLGLGRLKDDTRILKNAIDYLVRTGDKSNGTY